MSSLYWIENKNMTISQIGKEFYQVFDWLIQYATKESDYASNRIDLITANKIESFYAEKIKELLESVVPVEIKQIENPTYLDDMACSRIIGWNEARNQLLENIKKISE